MLIKMFFFFPMNKTILNKPSSLFNFIDWKSQFLNCPEKPDGGSHFRIRQRTMSSTWEFFGITWMALVIEL
ncbi:hypothetical protein VNO77_02994 [Canavalia gladiata]|uniref:Uncharacterized protein n=1 Tax=Canavalia gladiata TaxID=3824 RepID=A0AAN9MYY3_CANGL